MTDLEPFTPSLPPPGWYDHEGRKRFWDGMAWTDHYVGASGIVVSLSELQTRPPGWYPDDQGLTRWWDGARWTTQVQQAAQPKRTDFSGLTVVEHWIFYQGEGQPVAGVQAIVESAGQLHTRSTVTRTAAGGLLFGPAGLIVGAMFRKKVDLRELYLLIDGPQLAWAVPVMPKLGAQARAFAAWVNTLSKHYTAYPPA